MKSFIASLFILVLLAPTSFSSDLKMSIEIKKTNLNQTRSYDGKPGSSYWQNYSEYNIKAEIDPKSRMLTGSEKIVYYNNSPDTIKNIVLNVKNQEII